MTDDLKHSILDPRKKQYFPMASEEHNTGNLDRRTTRFLYSGVKRRPKRGEWYLSGDPIEAWQAVRDLSTEYHIAVPVPGRMVWEPIEPDSSDKAES